MIANDILRLAGLDITIDPSTPKEKEIELPQINSCIKYGLTNAIEYYNSEYDKARSENVKQVYCEIIKSLDNILGCVLQNKTDAAKELFNQLDDRVKSGLLKYDESLANFFCGEPTPYESPQTTTDEPESKEPELKIIKVTESKDIFPDVDVLDISDTLHDEEEEKVEEIDVPKDVITDIKLRIKELDDGNNHTYTAHLSDFEVINQQYDFAKKMLENLLEYLMNPDEQSIRYATLYVSTLDSVMKSYIPISVWKFLAISYSPGSTIKDILQQIKGTK
jgi:hypothetical protein